jgi:hypothetical protein
MRFRVWVLQHAFKIFLGAPLRVVEYSGLVEANMQVCGDEAGLMAHHVVRCLDQHLQQFVGFPGLDEKVLMSTTEKSFSRSVVMGSSR